MIRPLAALSVAATALVLSGAPSAEAGACATQYVPRRGEVIVCTTERGCAAYVDPGGRTIAMCVEWPVDRSPFAGCTAHVEPWQACVLTEECTVFFTTGRPPGLCV